jgi:hypothetical protein
MLVLAPLLLLLSCSSGARLPASSPAAYAGPSAVASVENGGLLFTDNQGGVTGTDGGYSIPLPTQTLWVFGDCFLISPKHADGQFIGGVSDCGALAPRGKGREVLRSCRFLTDPLTGAARQLLGTPPSPQNMLRWWPVGGWYSPIDRRVYLYYGLIRVNGDKPLDFTGVGNGLASAEVSGPNAFQFRIERASPHEELWWKQSEDGATYGNAVVLNCPGPYLYLVGCKERPEGQRARMARVAKEKIADRSAYEYYAGGEANPTWTKDARKAAAVSGLYDFPSEISVAYNPFLHGYLAVHSVGIWSRARLCLADNPWGPYRMIAEIGTPKRAFSSGWCYAGKEHPELQEENGRIIYVTYVDSDRYWLQLLKITLKR